MVARLLGGGTPRLRAPWIYLVRDQLHASAGGGRGGREVGRGRWRGREGAQHRVLGRVLGVRARPVGQSHRTGGERRSLHHRGGLQGDTRQLARRWRYPGRSRVTAGPPPWESRVMEIFETPLPGIGVRYEFTSELGDHVGVVVRRDGCLLYTSPSPRDGLLPRMPSS